MSHKPAQYAVSVVCSMTVWVEATNPAEAMEKANAGVLSDKIMNLANDSDFSFHSDTYADRVGDAWMRDE